MNTTATDKTAEIADPNRHPYEVVRFNALKHGILSRYTVLSHENHADYESLINSLMDEHLPAGATEQHLIEELASVIWLKRRVAPSMRLLGVHLSVNDKHRDGVRCSLWKIPEATLD